MAARGGWDERDGVEFEIRGLLNFELRIAHVPPVSRKRHILDYKRNGRESGGPGACPKLPS
jgi:hypothetical protein